MPHDDARILDRKKSGRGGAREGAGRKPKIRGVIVSADQVLAAARKIQAPSFFKSRLELIAAGDIAATRQLLSLYARVEQIIAAGMIAAGITEVADPDHLAHIRDRKKRSGEKFVARRDDLFAAAAETAIAQKISKENVPRADQSGD
jgi:hypothetical protein